MAVRNMKSPPISEDEIANAAGMGDVHDGVNFMRAACIIAVEKAQQSFEPVLDSLRHRAVHVMRRLFPIVESTLTYNRGSALSENNPHIDTNNSPFKEIIRKIFEKFVDQQIEICLSKCKDDLKGMTRFVTWDTDGRGGSAALYKSLPTPKRMVEIYSVAVETKTPTKPAKSEAQKRKENTDKATPHMSFDEKVIGEWGSASNSNNNMKSSNTEFSSSETALTNRQWKEDETQVSEYFELMQLMEEMLAGRQGGRTTTVVVTLVQYIISSWRNHFARTVAMKFNCFFLMPFLDDFPAFLRDEIDQIYEGGMGELFDITEARLALQNRKTELIAECDANSKLQRRFDLINSQLRSSAKGKLDSNSHSSSDEFDVFEKEKNDFDAIEISNDVEDEPTAQNVKFVDDIAKKDSSFSSSSSSPSSSNTSPTASSVLESKVSNKKKSSTNSQKRKNNNDNQNQQAKPTNKSYGGYDYDLVIQLITLILAYS